MSTDNSFSDDVVSASTPFSNNVKRVQQLKMEMRENNKEKTQKMKIYLCPKISFVKPVVKDFLTERKIRGELIFDFALGGRIPPLKPLGSERYIDMGCCHLLKFFYRHIRVHEGGKMTVNLQHMRV
jgi:hypothetical protein